MSCILKHVDVTSYKMNVIWQVYIRTSTVSHVNTSLFSIEFKFLILQTAFEMPTQALLGNVSTNYCLVPQNESEVTHDEV